MSLRSGSWTPLDGKPPEFLVKDRPSIYHRQPSGLLAFQMH